MQKKENIIAIIPARGGSKGIPRKNIKLFNGSPLIYYAIKLAEEAQKRGIIAGHIVSTDDGEIASTAKDLGGNVPFLRPAELAADDSLVIDTIIHAVNWWQEEHKDTIHSVLILQPTSPLTGIEDIEKTAKYYLKNQPAARCLISVCDAPYNIRDATLYYKEGNCLEQAIKSVSQETRRQDLRKLYWRNGAVYITRRDILLEGKIMDNSPLCYEMSKFRSIAIDDMFDWRIAEFLMRSRLRAGVLK